MAAQVGVQTAVTAPLYPSVDFYPTSPIHTFPPPAPAHQSLRARCGVTMRLQLTTHTLNSPPTLWSPKGHVQPHRHNLPRRRNPKRIVVVDHDPDVIDVKAATKAIVEAATHAQPQRNNIPRCGILNRVAINEADHNGADGATSKPMSEQSIALEQPCAGPSHPPIESPYCPSINADDPHLRCLVPNVFMAFSESNTHLEQLPGYLPDEPYTHIVHIDYTDAPATQRITEGRTQHLHLNLPSSVPTTGTTRAGLELTDAQLRAARDFMAEALPIMDSPSGVRVLVTGLHGRPTNIVCVAACYYAFVSGKSMEDALLFIDSEEDMLSTWKGEVTEDEAGRVEKIARAWSWLSNIIRPEIHN